MKKIKTNKGRKFGTNKPPVKSANVTRLQYRLKKRGRFTKFT